MKKNKFWGDLTDISAKQEPLLRTCRTAGSSSMLALPVKLLMIKSSCLRHRVTPETRFVVLRIESAETAGEAPAGLGSEPLLLLSKLPDNSAQYEP